MSKKAKQTNLDLAIEHILADMKGYKAIYEAHLGNSHHLGDAQCHLPDPSEDIITFSIVKPMFKRTRLRLASFGPTSKLMKLDSYFHAEEQLTLHGPVLVDLYKLRRRIELLQRRFPNDKSINSAVEVGFGLAPDGSFNLAKLKSRIQASNEILDGKEGIKKDMTSGRSKLAKELRRRFVPS